MVTHILQSSTACARQALTSDPSPHAAFIAIDMQTPALKKRLSARHSSAALRKIPTASRSPGCSIGRSENKPPNKSFASLIDFPRAGGTPLSDRHPHPLPTWDSARQYALSAPPDTPNSSSSFSRPPARLNLYNISGRRSSTEVDGWAVERHLDDRARPPNLRNRRGRTLPAAQFHPPACARSLRRRGHRAGSLLRTGRSQSPADAHLARDRLAFSRRAQSHHGPFPQEEAGALQRRSSRGRRRRSAADRRSVAIARCRAGSAVLPQRASG